MAATPSEVRALRDKVAPLLDAMRRDPATSATIASIERLEVSGTLVRPCGPTEPSDTSAATGTPTRCATRCFPRSAATGAPSRPPSFAPPAPTTPMFAATSALPPSRSGVRDIASWLRSSGRSPTDRPRCRGLVDLVQRRAKLRWNPATPCTEYIAFSWKRDGRDLEIVALDPRTERGWTKAFLGTWKLVDCTPIGPEWPVCDHHRDQRVAAICPLARAHGRADPFSVAVLPAAARQRPASRHPAATRPPDDRRGLRRGRRARRALIPRVRRRPGRRPRR